MKHKLFFIFILLSVVVGAQIIHEFTPDFSITLPTDLSYYDTIDTFVEQAQSKGLPFDASTLDTLRTQGVTAVSANLSGTIYGDPWNNDLCTPLSYENTCTDCTDETTLFVCVVTNTSMIDSNLAQRVNLTYLFAISFQDAIGDVNFSIDNKNKSSSVFIHWKPVLGNVEEYVVLTKEGELPATTQELNTLPLDAQAITQHRYNVSLNESISLLFDQNPRYSCTGLTCEIVYETTTSSPFLPDPNTLYYEQGLGEYFVVLDIADTSDVSVYAKGKEKNSTNLLEPYVREPNPDDLEPQLLQLHVESMEISGIPHYELTWQPQTLLQIDGSFEQSTPLRVEVRCADAVPNVDGVTFDLATILPSAQNIQQGTILPKSDFSGCSVLVARATDAQGNTFTQPLPLPVVTI